MSVLDIQRSGQQIGRIRIGQQVSTGKTNKDGSEKMRPARLDTFRFTTGSKVAADAIAELFGGEVREWAGHRGQYEVITRESAIGVTIPPRDAIVSQHYEFWSAGGCQRRCNSQVQESGAECECPHAADPGNAEEVANAALKRAELAKLNPPRACKLITRINVMIPDLPGLGVFRIDTHSYYAAREIGDAAALMQMARDKGLFLPAILRIDHRQRVANGQTTPYPVPVLEVLATFRALATGQIAAGGMAAQLPPAPGEAPKAITAGPPAAPGAAQAPAPAVAQDAASFNPDGDLYEPPDSEGWQRAAEVAARAVAAADANALKECFTEAERDRLKGEPVCIDRDNDEWQDLGDFLHDLWEERAREAGQQ